MRALVRGLILAAAAMLLPGASAAASEKPNILFIAVDDLNDWTGCLGGHPQAKTPHMDRLAARGTVFLNAHCQAPLCNPSRTSLLTGLRPDSTGIYGLSPWFRTLPEFADLVTLPQYFKKNGYRTYSTGKIHHGPHGRGQDDGEFDVIGPGGGVGVRPTKPLVNAPSGHPLVDWGVFPHDDKDKGDWQITEWAAKELDKKPEGPFFLSVGYFLPHVPCYASQRWFDLHPEETLRLPLITPRDRADTPRFSWYLHWKLPEPRLKFLEESDQWKNLVRSYLACVSFVDSQIGKLLDALERNDFQDNTIIVLWSDHGWHLGEKEITGKNTLWEDGTRVPLIFAGPGVAKGQRCAKPAELLDIYPTLLELAGLPANARLEGHSLGPQLRDAGAERPWPAITTHNRDNHGIRSEHWRYIRHADGSEELYDHRSDPNEWRNVAADPANAAVIAGHRRWIPANGRSPAPGSAHRILTYENGRVSWEGETVPPGAKIPEYED